MPKSRQILTELIASFREEELSVQEFCSRYENAFNFQISKDQLEQKERSAFQQLFDEVVLYSPFPEDRKEYRGYRDEQAIRQAASQAWSQLQ